MYLLALSIPNTVFLSQFLTIAFGTCKVHDIMIASIWNTKAEMSERKSEFARFGPR